MLYKSLETERLILREWRLEDAEDLYEYAGNPEVGPMAGWTPHSDRAYSLEVLKRYRESGDIWAVALRETGKVIGQLRMYPDENRGKYVAKYISYALSADYWGQGLMTEAVKAVIRYAFEEEEGIDLLSVFHSPDNARTRRVIEKCGFTFEITLKDAYAGYDGQVCDSVCYSLLREAYFAAKKREEGEGAGDSWE
ncbi:MAG: GNAT family N-acetyltransferase [Lachnospiraceae bacterium]|nr:GNAT family N-acetyltransferase [Lachnospiraceae bacterium]